MKKRTQQRSVKKLKEGTGNFVDNDTGDFYIPIVFMEEPEPLVICPSCEFEVPFEPTCENCGKDLDYDSRLEVIYDDTSWFWQDVFEEFDSYLSKADIDENLFKVSLESGYYEGAQIFVKDVFDVDSAIYSKLEWDADDDLIQRLIKDTKMTEEQAAFFIDYDYEKVQALWSTDEDLWLRIIDFFKKEEIDKISTFLKKVIDELGFQTYDMEYFEPYGKKDLKESRRKNLRRKALKEDEDYLRMSPSRRRRVDLEDDLFTEDSFRRGDYSDYADEFDDDFTDDFYENDTYDSWGNSSFDEDYSEDGFETEEYEDEYEPDWDTGPLMSDDINLGICDRFSYDAVTGRRSGGGLYESIINEARSSKELIGSFLDGLKIVKEVVKSIERKYKVKEISIGDAYERLTFVSSPVTITVSKTIEDVEDIKKIIDEDLVDNIKIQQGNKIILSLHV